MVARRTLPWPSGYRKCPINSMTFLKKLSPHNQIVASDMLEGFGLTSDIAVNGQQAEDSVEDRVNTGKPYDLVLMDVQIPVRRGYETAEEIRHQSHSHLKICGLSANAMRSDFSKRLQHGKDDYVTKPIA